MQSYALYFVRAPAVYTIGKRKRMRFGKRQELSQQLMVMLGLLKKMFLFNDFNNLFLKKTTTFNLDVLENVDISQCNYTAPNVILLVHQPALTTKSLYYISLWLGVWFIK